MKTLFTIGYGNDPPEKFLKRLKDAGVTFVLDVRRVGSRSWCNQYHQGKAMLMTVRDMGEGCSYLAWMRFGNSFDDLYAYKAWLKRTKERLIEYLASGLISGSGYSVYCLLCSERDAYKDGKVNCHRVYVADALLKELGEGWEVQHL